MTLKEAATILGVDLMRVTENDLSIAFARAVKLAHPDTGGGREGSVEALDKAKKARNLLREFIEKGGYQPCGRCGGKGRIAGKQTFTSVVCPACGGKG